MRRIFVFGSNLAGIHGGGAAKDALNRFGAIWGQGIGLQGESYAIPTKDYSIRTLSLASVHQHIKTFIEYARRNEDMEFYVTAIGTGLAGFSHAEIAPLFVGAPPARCTFPAEWKPYMNESYTFRSEGDTI